jgi:3-methyladenine DNA glycosylase/8-oxoguanine DNA glycosylase
MDWCAFIYYLGHTCLLLELLFHCPTTKVPGKVQAIHTWLLEHIQLLGRRADYVISLTNYMTYSSDDDDDDDDHMMMMIIH